MAEYRIAHLDGKREDALASLESLIEQYRENAGAKATSASQQAYANVAEDLDDVAATLRRYT